MTSLPVRTGVEGATAYGAPELDVPIRLNVNENPYAPSDEVRDSIRDAVAAASVGLNRYPVRDFPQLRAALADYLAHESGVTLAPEQIWAANGSNEVMLHVLQAFGGPGRTVVSFTPTYSMYPEYARDSLTEYRTLPRREDFSLDVDAAVDMIRHDHPSVIIIASPNNPTGTALPLDDIRVLADACRGQGPLLTTSSEGSSEQRADCVLVIDEAYAEFRREGVRSALTLLEDYGHLAVSRTMSKAFGMAGLRLGYLAAQEDLVSWLRVVRLPYHLSAVTQAAACAALSHRDSLMAQVASLRDERDALVAWLREQGMTAWDSDANFVLFGPFQDRELLWQRLVERGILIRVVGPEGYLRTSVGTPEEMAAFRQAMSELLADPEIHMVADTSSSLATKH